MNAQVLKLLEKLGREELLAWMLEQLQQELTEELVGDPPLQIFDGTASAETLLALAVSAIEEGELSVAIYRLLQLKAKDWLG